jgi:PIN domain nuclease of toxin-antitoxin system
MKRMLGRATEIGDLHSRFESVGIAIEPFDYNAARAIARFPSLHNHDPFDRLILAHAASRPTTTFYTADTRLLNLGLDWVVDARA